MAKTLTLLDAAGSAGAGDGQTSPFWQNRATIYTKTANSADLTVAIELYDGTDWHPFDSKAYTTDGKQEIISIGPEGFEKIRANVTSWTAGDVTVTAIMHRR